MKIELYQYNFCLGELTYENNTYTYVSNPANEQACKKASLGCMDYRLFNSNPKQAKTLFPEYARWVSVAKNREDIAKQAGVLDADSDWEILVKLGKLSGFCGGEAIKTIE